MPWALQKQLGWPHMSQNQGRLTLWWAGGMWRWQGPEPGARPAAAGRFKAAPEHEPGGTRSRGDQAHEECPQCRRRTLNLPYWGTGPEHPGGACPASDGDRLAVPLPGHLVQSGWLGPGGQPGLYPAEAAPTPEEDKTWSWLDRGQAGCS